MLAAAIGHQHLNYNTAIITRVVVHIVALVAFGSGNFFLWMLNALSWQTLHAA